jgi:hypothetical protein
MSQAVTVVLLGGAAYLVYQFLKQTVPQVETIQYGIQRTVAYDDVAKLQASGLAPQMGGKILRGGYTITYFDPRTGQTTEQYYGPTYDQVGPIRDPTGNLVDPVRLPPRPAELQVIRPKEPELY